MIPGPTIYYKCPICELLTSNDSIADFLETCRDAVFTIDSIKKTKFKYK